MLYSQVHMIQQIARTICEVIEWVVNCKQLDIMGQIEFYKQMKQHNLDALLFDESGLFAVSYINKKEAQLLVVTIW